MKQLSGLDARFSPFSRRPRFRSRLGFAHLLTPGIPGYTPHEAWRAQLAKRLDLLVASEHGRQAANRFLPLAQR